MNVESLAIVGLTLIGLALPVMGAWFYQVFALKRELADTERRLAEMEGRLAERINRVEDNARRSDASAQQLFRDLDRVINRIDGRLEERKP